MQNQSDFGKSLKHSAEYLQSLLLPPASDVASPAKTGNQSDDDDDDQLLPEPTENVCDNTQAAAEAVAVEEDEEVREDKALPAETAATGGTGGGR